MKDKDIDVFLKDYSLVATKSSGSRRNSKALRVFRKNGNQVCKLKKRRLITNFGKIYYEKNIIID